MTRRRIRVLLDANVWRYVLDAGAVNKLEQVSKRRDLVIQVAPSVVYEALRTSDANLRQALAGLMTRRTWSTLMPDAYEESEEFLREARRLRPHWMRESPELTERRANRVDWLRGPGGFWDRLRRSPDEVAKHVSALEGRTLDVAREGVQDRRHLMQEAGWSYHSVEPSAVVGLLPGPVSGWDGDAVPFWRLEALFWASRAFPQSPYADWIGGLIDDQGAHLYRDASWVRFWLYDCDSANIPRWWIRGACEVLQALRKVTPGTPCDAQLATYTFSTDVFVTFDRALGEVLERCRAVSPAPMAWTCTLAASSDPAPVLIHALDTMRRGRIPAQ